MDILQCNNDAFVGRYVDAGDAGHSLPLLLPARAGASDRCYRRRFTNDNATPSPFLRARYRSTSRLGCGLLRDSTSFRQPPPRTRFAPGRLAPHGSAPAGFGRFRLGFRRLGGGGRCGASCYASSPWLSRRFLSQGLPKRPVDRARHLRNGGHAVDRAKNALELVVRSEWRGLLAVPQKPAPHHLRIIILAQRLAP